MAPQLSLSAAASRDIRKILRHSSRTFGADQRLIQQALKRIAEEPLCIGSKPCEEIRGELRSLHIARAATRQSATAHVIYYSAAKLGENWSVTVIRVLHDRMDPELHIANEDD